LFPYDAAVGVGQLVGGIFTATTRLGEFLWASLGAPPLSQSDDFSVGHRSCFECSDTAV
jgi:hypothetical protein